jgi:hypothetical protein
VFDGLDIEKAILSGAGRGTLPGEIPVEDPITLLANHGLELIRIIPHSTDCATEFADLQTFDLNTISEVLIEKEEDRIALSQLATIRWQIIVSIVRMTLNVYSYFWLLALVDLIPATLIAKTPIASRVTRVLIVMEPRMFSAKQAAAMASPTA